MISLYDYQKDALNLLKPGSILCGGVGSGKSRTALAYYFIKECGGAIEQSGKSVYRPMTTPKPLYVITTARKRDTLDWEGEAAPFLINQMVVDSWNNIKKYIEVKDAFFIFDEQRVVGSGTWVKSFIKITKNNNWILLSATPGDTWVDYIPVFVANGFYKNRTEFLRRHVVYSHMSKFPKVDRYIETKHLEKLRSSILINMDYRKKTRSHYESVLVPFNKDLFKLISLKRWNTYDDTPIQNAGELCYLLRKVVNSDPGRLIAVEYLITKHPKTIIFYNFDYELLLLRKLMEDLKMPFKEWNGHKHEQLPEGDRWVYLVQYTAGAEAWNCITTNVVIFYSQNYSYKITVQAAGRIDRNNTPYEDLYYYTLRSPASIDLAILKALKSKKNFNASSFVSNFSSREKHSI